MSRPSITILPPNLEPAIDRIGEKIAAAGFYGHTLGLHTISFTLLNFQGKLYLEGSLALNPQDSDWFALPIGRPYFEFPSQEFPTTSQVISGGVSKTIGVTFFINCLWIRSRIIRSYLIPAGATPGMIKKYGVVDTVLGNWKK